MLPMAGPKAQSEAVRVRRCKTRLLAKGMYRGTPLAPGDYVTGHVRSWRGSREPRMREAVHTRIPGRRSASTGIRRGADIHRATKVRAWPLPALPAVCIAIPMVYRYVRTCHPRLNAFITVSYLYVSLSSFSGSTAAFSSSVFETVAGGSAELLLCGRSCSSRARSFLKSGKNRSIRFQDSDHSFSFVGS